jgi:hypothetical protein
VYVVYIVIALAAVALLVFSLISPLIFAAILVVMFVVYFGMFMVGRREPAHSVSPEHTATPSSSQAAYHPSANPRRTGGDLE